jgi:hypothetical protein
VSRFAAAIIAGCLLTSFARAASLEEVIARRDADFAAGQPLVAHVVVALCDNQFQGIVPVPGSLGNGADPRSNLYWGALYGVRTYFRRSSQWTSLPVAPSTDPRVLDRVLFRREVSRDGKRGEVFLLAEAWNGRYMADAVRHFLEMNRGEHAESLRAGERRIEAGAMAHVTAFAGHNGLMDFAAPVLPRSPVRPAAHASVVLACLSDSYFGPLLREHSVPLLTTTGLMAPEAYTLDAALTAWFSGSTPEEVRRAAALAYARYQKTSERSALRLFRTPSTVRAP